MLATLTAGESSPLREKIHGFEADHDGSPNRGNAPFLVRPNVYPCPGQRTRPGTMTLPFNPFRIDWNDCTFGQWEALLARCKRPTLLQTWQYGVAMAK